MSDDQVSIETLPPPLVWVHVKADARVGWVDPEPLAGYMIRVVFEWDDGAFWPEELEEIYRS